MTDFMVNGIAIIWTIAISLWLIAKLYDPQLGRWQMYNPFLKAYSSEVGWDIVVATVRLARPEYDPQSKTTYRWQTMILRKPRGLGYWMPTDRTRSSNRADARKRHREYVNECSLNARRM